MKIAIRVEYFRASKRLLLTILNSKTFVVEVYKIMTDKSIVLINNDLFYGTSGEAEAKKEVMVIVTQKLPLIMEQDVPYDVFNFLLYPTLMVENVDNAVDYLYDEENY